MILQFVTPHNKKFVSLNNYDNVLNMIHLIKFMMIELRVEKKKRTYEQLKFWEIKYIYMYIRSFFRCV